jgi:hypothetical protein
MSARAEPVTYEVRLEFEQALAPEVDAWLPDHIAGMLRLPGFLSAQTLDDAPLPVPADGKIRRCVQYRLTSREALANYLREHASGMRAAAAQRFGDRVQAARRVLEPMDELVTSGARTCANCHTLLSGQYCAVCGQRDRTRMISVWELVADFVGEFLNFDSRFWRTIHPLVFRPGRLTSEYLRGRRVHFTPPLRLYVISSLIFFLLATSGNGDSTFEFDGDKGAAVTQTGETPPAAQPPDAADPADLPPPPAVGATPADSGDAAQDEDFVGWDISEGKCNVPQFSTGHAFIDGPVHDRMKHACDRIVADHGRAFLKGLVDNIPRMLFFFLPVIAVAMKPLYLGSRRYYVEHLLFFVHFHSFVFVALTLTLITTSLHEYFEGWGWGLMNGLTIAAVCLYIPYYLFRSLRVVYGQGRFVTLIKYVMLFFTYVCGLALLFVIGAVFTALTV